MSWINTAFHGLFTTAVVSLVVLAAGGLLAWCWNRPIERLRCLQGTFLAVILACLLQPLHVFPSIPLAWLPAEPDQVVATNESGQGSDGRAGYDGVVRQRPRRSDVRDAELAPAMDRAEQPAAAVVTSAEPPAGVPVVAAAPRAASSLLAWIPATALAVFFLGAAWSLVRLAIGISCLRRLEQSAVPASGDIIARLQQIQGASRRRVTVLVSDLVDAPITFGIVRPVIVLPASMAHSTDSSELHNCLAHEWSHVRNFDVAQWWGLQLLQPLLWYQPLYWLLRRELRIGQDQLADHFAAVSTSDSIAYAELLVRMAKKRRVEQIGVALTMSDRGKSLTRRVVLLLSAQHHLTPLCRRWALASAIGVLSIVTCATGILKLERARAQADGAGEKMGAQPKMEAPAKNDATAQSAAGSQKPIMAGGSAEAAVAGAKPSAAVLGEERPDGSILYTGRVVEKGTKTPVKGAQVTVHRKTISSFDRRDIEDTTHVTDDQGWYSFTIPPEQVAVTRLYIELDVDHPDYARKAGFGYALSMIRKNAKLGDPPFFAEVRLDPADAVTGRTMGPDGQPLSGVHLLAYSKPPGSTGFSDDDYGSFYSTQSTDDGSFRLKLIQGGNSIFWIVPEQYAPRQIVSGAKRGEWGDIEMRPGIGLTGQVVDAEGKPLSGVWVNLVDEDSRSEIQMPVATSLARSGLTDAEGHFSLAPLKAGAYTVEVDTYPDEIRFHPRKREPGELPAVFPRRKLTIGDGQGPLLVRAAPHVQFDAQYVDAKGEKKRGGWDPHLTGRLDGNFFFARLPAGEDGHVHGLVPHGLENAEIRFTSNEHGALRIRMGHGQPLSRETHIKLGTIQADITGVEIFRYTAPIVQLKVVDETGQPISGAKVAAVYDAADEESLRRPVDNLPTSIFFEKQPDGRFRTSQMLPDEPTKFIASAESYDDAQETLTLTEGENRDLTLVLKKKSPAANSTSDAAKPARGAEFGEEQADGSIICTGQVTDRTTATPIPGVKVTVHRQKSAEPEWQKLEDSEHTTDAAGTFSFAISPQQLAENALFIQLEIEHPGYMSLDDGYSLGTIRKNARLGDPPFFANVKLTPSDPVTGRIIGPDGQPLAGVHLLAYSQVGEGFLGSSFTKARSAADGTFRLNMTKEGPGVFWVVPEKFAPRQFLTETKRGDWGDIQVQSGVGLQGQVLDAEGKPLAGLWVNVDDTEAHREIQMSVAGYVARSGLTDAEGRFEIGPLKPGEYDLAVEGYPDEIRFHKKDQQNVVVPAAFPHRTITIGQSLGEPLVIRAAPHVQFEAQYVNSQGEKASGWNADIFGRLDGQAYLGTLKVDADGRVRGLIPHGLEKTQLRVHSNDQSSLRVRLARNKPAVNERRIELGTVESDITDVQIIRYVAPFVQLKVVDEAGQVISGAKVAGIYETADKEKLGMPVNGLPSSIYFDNQPDGRFRTAHLLPNEKTQFLAQADGYEKAEETLSLAEGENRELTLVLRKKAPAANSTSDNSNATPGPEFGEERADGSIFYVGKVTDRDTQAPIAGVIVTIHRWISSDYERQKLEATHHTTDEFGKYFFTVPPEQVAEKALYLEASAEHPDYAPKGRSGYSLAMIRKNARLGDPPFFAHIKLSPSDSLTGRIVGPDGQALAGVLLSAYSKAPNASRGSFVNARSADDGTFRLKMAKGGAGVFWVVPEKFTPRQFMTDTRRVDWGDIQMQPGVGLKGRVVDAEGKPLVGLWVNVTDPDAGREIQMSVSTLMRRSSLTDADGRFEIAPLKPGSYDLAVEDHPSEIRFLEADRKPVAVPAVFLGRTISLGGTAPESLLIRAVPHVQFEGQYVDSKGEKTRGWDLDVSGQLDGQSYFGSLKIDASGQVRGIIPHGLERARLHVTANEHSSWRVRLGKDKPLFKDRQIDLGAVESDILGVEIIRYVAPIVQLKVLDEAGQAVSKPNLLCYYPRDTEGPLTTILVERQSDGRLRTSQMLPDEKTKFTVTADGYEKVEETLSLAEGEVRDLTLVLKKSIPGGDQKVSAASMAPQSAPRESPKQETIATATQQPAAGTSITDIGEQQADGSVVCSGVVVDQTTQAPVVGVQIKVRRKLPGQLADETTHTSDQSGQYSFTLTRDQVAEAKLQVSVILEHPQYAPRSVYHEPLGAMRENNKLGDPPGFARIALDPSDPLTGRIVTPSGEPLAGLSIEAFAVSPSGSQFFHAKSDEAGRFQMNLFRGTAASVWMMPDKYAPRQVFISSAKHDLSDIALEEGTSLKGQLLDAEGRPLLGAWVIATDEAARMEAATQRLTTHISRSSQTDQAGQFEIGPMQSGRTYTLHVAGEPEENSAASVKRVAVPAVFLRREVLFAPGTQEPLVLRAVPHVEINLQFLDGQGAPTRGSAIQLTGRIDQGFYSDYLYPDADGHARGLVPHGLEQTTLHLQNIDGPVRARAGVAKPLEHGDELVLGRVETDVSGVEIIRHKSPAVFLKPVDEAGRPVAGIKVAGVYETDDESKLRHADGELPSSVYLNKRPDGRFRTWEMLPNEPTRFVAAADGYETARKTLSLAEGEYRELTLVMKRSVSAAMPAENPGK